MNARHLKDDARANYCDRRLHAKAGEVGLKVLRLRKLPFERTIIERYQRRENSAREALASIWLAYPCRLGATGNAIKAYCPVTGPVEQGGSNLQRGPQINSEEPGELAMKYQPLKRRGHDDEQE